MSAWLKDLYRKVDAMDAKGFADVFLPDGVLQWANAEPLRGPAPIEQTIAGFFGTIAGLRHEFVNVVEHGEHVFFEARVTYTRKDGSHVSVNACTTFRRNGDKVAHCSVYVDLAPLYA